MEETQNFFSFLLGSMGEAFFSIIIWVVLAFFVTQMLLFYYKDKIILAIKGNKNLEIFFSALLGLIPGCGGSIFLIPLYKEKVISFGSLCAAFITTLGETTFIFLFFNPIAFLIFLLISLVVSLIVGYLVNIFNTEERLELNKTPIKKEEDHKHTSKKELSKKTIKVFELFDNYILPGILLFFVVIVLPLTLITSFAFHNNYNDWVDTYITVANYLSLIVFFIFIPYKIFRDYFEKRLSASKSKSHYHTLHSNDERHEINIDHKRNKQEELYHELHHVFITLLFIIFWIYISIILISIIVYIANISNDNDFSNSSNFAVTQAAGYRFLILVFVLVVSLIPVCGPQIFIVTLFGQGYISFSAISANSISQNGHAGLAMLAVDKKSYFWLKSIVIIPAFIIGLFFFIIEITTDFPNWILGFNRSII